jgi:predicted AlkP superfamily pyrophosphatase or phosphodiesterase
MGRICTVNNLTIEHNESCWTSGAREFKFVESLRSHSPKELIPEKQNIPTTHRLVRQKIRMVSTLVHPIPLRALGTPVLFIVLVLSTLAPLAGAQSGNVPPVASPQMGHPSPAQKIEDLRPTVVLVSIDGFRPDYLDRTPSPNLHKLAESGVRGSLIPCFPSKTFPNHYSIVTGLYPAEHGIVANTFEDAQLGTFKLSDHDQLIKTGWWGGEPFWVTAEKQGQHTGIEYWPGAEAAIEGVRPKYWEAYDKKKSSHARAEQILSWLDLPQQERPTFLSVYFDVVDTAGHEFGPDSEEVKQEIAKVDEAIGTMLDGLEERGIADKINLVIVSDHGMASMSRERVVLLDDYLDPESLEFVEQGPAMLFKIKDGNAKQVLNKLAKVPHLKIYARDDTPARWHYRANTRITPYVGMVDEGWAVTTRKYLQAHPKYPERGNHGFDNDLMSMRAIFIAHGPAFKKGAELPAVSNINIYSLMSELLALKPARNEGNAKVFAGGMSNKQAAGVAGK